MKYMTTVFEALLALLIAGQASAGPTDSLVKESLAGVRLGTALDQALITLKKQGYQLKSTPSVSCSDTQFEDVTIKPCDLQQVELEKVDSQGSNDIYLEVTPGVSERLDWAEEEAIVWRMTMFVTLDDPNQSTRATFEAMISSRYPNLQPVDAGRLADFTNCDISAYNRSLPAFGSIQTIPADPRFPLSSSATILCTGVFAAIANRPGFGSVRDKPGLDIVFFDNDLRDRVNAITYKQLAGWAKQDARRPVAPRF